MSDQLQFNDNSTCNQSELSSWIHVIRILYQHFVPDSIRNRRNVKKAKVSDITILALMCWQVALKMTVQTRFYQFLTMTIFKGKNFPERSRFNRICRQDGGMLRIIRSKLIQSQQPTYTIIDSMPMPLCQPIRNTRAKVLKPDATIGYNSTKRQYYYGFKGSFEVGDNGIFLAYTISSAAIMILEWSKRL